MPFPQGHALLIGVGTHQHCPWLDLPGTAADVEAVASVLQDEMACGYPAAQVRLLTHGEATRAGILAALDDLAAEQAPATPFCCSSAATARCRAATTAIISWAMTWRWKPTALRPAAA